MRDLYTGSDQLDTKRKAAMILFIVISISTLLFSGYLIYYTYQVGTFSGTTTVHGRIVDVNGDPLEGVMVVQDDMTTVTDSGGYWVLEGVDEGLITIRCYKEGYVPYRTEWLAYPDEERWIGSSESDSPNNLSVYSDIELRKEITYIDMDDGEEGSLEVFLTVDPVMNVTGRTLRLTDGVNGEVEPHRLDDGVNRFTIETDGFFSIGVDGNNTSLTGYHPLEGTIDITASFREMVLINESVTWEPSDAYLNINLNHSFDPGSINISIRSGRYNTSIVLDAGLDNGETGAASRNITIPPGTYSVEITGIDIRDIGFENITMVEGEVLPLKYDLLEGDVLVGYSQRSTDINYIYALFYIIMAGAMIYGSIRVRKEESSWAPLIILAFLGFFTRGPIDLYIFNINGILSLALLILIIYIRRDIIKKK
ncbi:MAG: carboxypeptidase-like regulatory domain-containing protein [Thermoplasmatota archaeon]